MRRAAAEGLIHGQRESPRRFSTSLSEENYLRQHWGLLRDLRGSLRTEPSIRLAVLFGSVARGDGRANSDLDVMVTMDDPAAHRLAAVTGRLEARLSRDVQLVRLEDTDGSPVLAADALRDGRVLTDRDGEWPAVKRRLGRVARTGPQAGPGIVAPDLGERL